MTGMLELEGIYAGYDRADVLHGVSLSIQAGSITCLLGSNLIVFGLQAKATGTWVPNELIADYAKQHPETIVGWASIGMAWLRAAAEIGSRMRSRRRGLRRSYSSQSRPT